jgi:hypothetical protein
VRKIIYTTDMIDKNFLPISTIILLCGRPRGEAWRVGRKRHRAALSVPAGLRRPHTRRLFGARGSFPTDEAATKLIYLAIRSFEKTERAVREWVAARNQFAILYPDRFNK